MKTKIYRTMPFMLLSIFFALFSLSATVVSGQEEALQGVWFDACSLIKITFYNNGFETEVYGRPNDRGEYTVVGNEITHRRTYVHSSVLGSWGDRWLSREEVAEEFGDWADSWFAPFVRTFSINDNILILVDRFGEQGCYIRIR